MGYYKNKHVYITGGSSGIGLEIARKLFSYGANLTIIARNSAKLEEARRNIEPFKVSSGQFIRCLSVDVSDSAELSRVISQAMKEFGAPDILINSAGIITCDYLGNIPYDKFDAVMKINLYGTRNMIAEVLPAMKKGGAYCHHFLNGRISGYVWIYRLRHFKICAGWFSRVSERGIEAEGDSPYPGMPA